MRSILTTSSTSSEIWTTGQTARAHQALSKPFPFGRVERDQQSCPTATRNDHRTKKPGTTTCFLSPMGQRRVAIVFKELYDSKSTR